MKFKKIVIIALTLIGAGTIIGGVTGWWNNTYQKNTSIKSGSSKQNGKQILNPIKTNGENTSKKSESKSKELSDSDLIPAKKSNAVRIGFWNILNYANKKNSGKDYAIAKVIDNAKADLVGLVEIEKGINNGDGIAAALNKLQPDSKWKQITSEIIGDNPNQQERYTFVYNATKVAQYPFDFQYKGVSGLRKKDWIIANVKTNIGTDFARPIAAARFALSKSSAKYYNLALSHFDSPDASNNRGEKTDLIYKNQGAQEIAEAKSTGNALININEQDKSEAGQYSGTIFMADTNIKNGNGEVFANLLKLKQAQELTQDAKKYKDEVKNAQAQKYKSSLGTKFGSYTNSYDKVFTLFKNIKASPAYVFPLWDVFAKGVIDKAEFDKLKIADDRANQITNDTKRIRSGISDHAPVFFDVEDFQ